jgi:hypothetical protein
MTTAQWGIKSLDVATDETNGTSTFTPTTLFPDQSTVQLPAIVVHPHMLKLFQVYFPVFLAWYNAKHTDGSGPDVVDMAELAAMYESIQAIPAPPPPATVPTQITAPPMLLDVPTDG